MAKKYLLGETAARWLHGAMNEGSSVGVGRGDVIVTPTDAVDPFTVRYSASVTNGATTGGWIIWIPTGAFFGAKVDTTTMRALTPSGDRMPDGWYLLPSSIQSTLSANGTHELYASKSLGYIKFSTSSTSGIKVADIVTDTTNATNKVTRIVRSTLLEANPRPFDIEFENGARVIKNQYYNVGERTYYGGVSVPDSVYSSFPCILALRVDITGSTPVASIQAYSTISALQSAQNNTSYAISPLYALDANGLVSCDLRNLPRIVSGEFAS